MPLLMELLSHLEGNKGAEGITPQKVGTLRLQLQCFLKVKSGHVFEPLERFPGAMQFSGLQTVKGPVRGEILGQQAIPVYPAFDGMHAKEGSILAFRLNRDHGSRRDSFMVPCDGFGEVLNSRLFKQDSGWKVPPECLAKLQLESNRQE